MRVYLGRPQPQRTIPAPWQWPASTGLWGLGTSTPVVVTPQLQTLAQLIQTQEVYATPGQTINGTTYPNGSVSYQNNNPGNLVYAGQAGATQGPNGFAVFPTYDAGLQALYNQLGLYSSGACGACGGQPLTIQQMANIYAPASQPGNDPIAYGNNMAAALGVSPDTLLSSALSGGGSTSTSLPTSISTDTTDTSDDGTVDDGIFDTGDDAILGFDPTFFAVAATGVAVAVMWAWSRTD